MNHELAVVVGATGAFLVRGGVSPLAPEDWSIAGEPASIQRATEIAARREGAQSSSAVHEGGRA